MNITANPLGAAKPMASATKKSLTIAKIGFFGLFALMFISNVFFPNASQSVRLGLLLWWLPLFLPLLGILKNKPYTFAWSNFIAAIYIGASATTFYLYPERFLWAISEFTLASMWFGAGSYYARWRGQELGLELKKSN